MTLRCHGACQGNFVFRGSLYPLWLGFRPIGILLTAELLSHPLICVVPSVRSLGPMELAEPAGGFSVPGMVCSGRPYHTLPSLGTPREPHPRGSSPESSWGHPVAVGLAWAHLLVPDSDTLWGATAQAYMASAVGVAVWWSHPGCKPKVMNALRQYGNAHRLCSAFTPTLHCLIGFQRFWPIHPHE